MWLHGRGVEWHGGGRGMALRGRDIALRGRGMAGLAHLLLELHADGVGLLEEYGVAP